MRNLIYTVLSTVFFTLLGAFVLLAGPHLLNRLSAPPAATTATTTAADPAGSADSQPLPAAQPPQDPRL